MKKKIAIIAAVVLAVGFGFFIYNQIIGKTFRYSTPTEAFTNSNLRNTDLVDILEDKDIALLIYKRKDGTFSDQIIAKDTFGWTPLSMNYKNRRKVSLDNGFIYYKEVQGKYVVQIVTTVGADEKLPVISDSMDSKFLSGLYELNSGKKLFYKFWVFNEKVPDNYKIYLENQEIAIY